MMAAESKEGTTHVDIVAGTTTGVTDGATQTGNAKNKSTIQKVPTYINDVNYKALTLFCACTRTLKNYFSARTSSCKSVQDNREVAAIPHI